MIPILFAPTATNFTTNGIGRLSDAISCTVHEARNGEFELEMEYPVDGAHYADIVHSAIIVAKPSARRSNQAFRVYKITKPMRGTVTILAQHISYQLSWIPVSPFTAANLTNALAYFKSMSAESNPFSFSADFTSDNDFAVPIPTSIRSYMGGRAGSILDIYGGEWLFDNYSVRLCRARGEDNGYTIQYGKNLTDLTQEESILNTYTGVYPYWGSEGTTVTLPEKVVHAPTAQNFPFQRTAVLDLSDKFDGMPSVEQLRNYTQRYITANNIGIPAVNLSIDFVNLPDTEEYKLLLTGAKNLDLCDTVTVIFAKLGISTKSKVVDIVWNVLADRYDSIQVGNVRSTLSGTIEETIASVDAAATMSQVAQKIDRATGVLNAGTRGHIVMNRNADGWANEILALNNDNIAAATRVLRINMNGIGFANSYAGPYAQAWTMDGTLSLGGVNNAYGNLVILDSSGKVIGRWSKDGIYANGGSLVIGNNFSVDSSGNLKANNGTFRGGTIQIGNKFRVDENGNLYATDGEFSGDIKSGSTITGAAIYGSTFGTPADGFYVTSNNDDENIVGCPGFTFEDKIMYSDWVGGVENPATDGDTAGINGRTGNAGFRRLYLLDGWYEGSDGSMWDVTRTIRWLDNRLRSIEDFCASHNWDGEEGGGDGDDPGSGGDDGYIDDGPVY